MSAGSRAFIALLIAGGLAGCGTTVNSAGRFQGAQAKVAAVVDTLSSAASSHDSGKICTKILAPAARATLQAKGGCVNDVGKQLDTVDTFNVTVKTVVITGTSAQATVTSTSNGKDKTDTLKLVLLADGSWRIASLG